MHRVTVVVRVVAPAPFEAAPDASACAAELTTHQPRSGSLPRDNIDQCCEVRLAANSTSIRLNSTSTSICHPLSVGITQLRGAEAPWSVEACHNDVVGRLSRCAEKVNQIHSFVTRMAVVLVEMLTSRSSPLYS